MPSHTHTGTTSTNGSHTHGYRVRNSTAVFSVAGGTGWDGFPAGDNATTGGSGNHNHTFTTNATGSGTAHNNLQPYLVVNYIIKATAGWTAGDSELATRVGQLELTRAPIASPSFTGNVTKASQSSFLVYSNTAYVGAGGWVNISRLPNSGGTATAAVEYNIGTNWNSANGRYTAPLSGRYEFFVGGWASYNVAGQRYAFSFRVNGGSLMYIGGGGTTAADSPLSNYNIVLNLSANDYVELHMFSAVAMNLGGAHAIHYGGYFLG
jgi:hypothetical protein